MKAKVLEDFSEGGTKFKKGETVPVWISGEEPKKKSLNLRRFNSLRNRGKVKGAK